MNKEITVFTEGDSNDSSVWSNVPYFLTKTLEEKGYTVHRINVDGNPLLKCIYDKFLCRVLRHTIFKKTSYAYERSILYALETCFYMKNAVKHFPGTSIYISTSFSFSPASYTSKPSILFCDWTYEYYIRHFLSRKPDCLERHAIRRQDRVIEKASSVFVLFPNIAEYMKQYYQNKNIFYLGNVINTDTVISDLAVINTKQSTKNILFIGLKKYKEGAAALIHAISLLRNNGDDIKLDIIGMDADTFSTFPDFVKYHGYLNKNIDAEKALYNSLLNSAAVYVNTTPKWAGFSSCLEALYHYTPVITTPYPSFTDTFGTSIPFGYYCNSNTPEAIASYISTLLELPAGKYLAMCNAAHESVLDFTWSSYVDKLLKQLEP